MGIAQAVDQFLKLAGRHAAQWLTLRIDLGRYDERLAAAGKDATNPLTPTVIHLYLPPDRYYAPSYFWSGDAPALRRAAAERHTAKMVKLGDYPAAQTHCYLCSNDGAWARIKALHAAAVAARQAWCDLLKRLGTYAEARADGRYSPAGLLG
jgi:hypothetical protein